MVSISPWVKLVALAAGMVLAVLLAVACVSLTSPRAGAPATGPEITLPEALGGDLDVRFARAKEPRAFVFPDDHGPHPEFKTEWWYFVGNLDTPEGRHFGFQLTFFRIALAPEAVERESDWGASQIYMGHFALTDVQAGDFYAFERFSREALGLAGARAAPFHVWLEDWSARSVGNDTIPIRLRAAEGGAAIDLVLDSAKPLVLQGKDGLSQKSAEPGNASYYYSMTRMPVEGTVRVGGQSFQVSGLGWLDREWSTSALGEEQVGWDWFALQMSDGRELMYYQIRLRDGGADPLSQGTLVAPDGSSRLLAPQDIHIEVIDHWHSPEGTRYPSRWRFAVPGEGIDLEVVPYLNDQRMDLSVRYWEGAVYFQGNSGGTPVTGRGYVEMTGYGSIEGVR